MNFTIQIDQCLHTFWWNQEHNNKIDEMRIQVNEISAEYCFLFIPKKKALQYCCTLTILQENQKL